MTKRPRTFISWSHADYRAGGGPLAFIERLRRQRMDAWWYLNSWDEPGDLGAPLVEKLRAEFERCECFIALVTDATVHNAYTNLEVGWAFSRWRADRSFPTILVVFDAGALHAASKAPGYRAFVEAQSSAELPIYHLLEGAGDDELERAIRAICSSLGIDYSPAFDREDPDLPALRRTFEEATGLAAESERRVSQLMDALFVAPGPELPIAYERRDYARQLAIISSLELQYQYAYGRDPYYLNVVRVVLELERGVHTVAAAAHASTLLGRLRAHPGRDYLVSSLEGHLALLGGRFEDAAAAFRSSAFEYQRQSGQPAITEVFNQVLAELASSHSSLGERVAELVETVEGICGNAPGDYDRHATLLLCLYALQPDRRRFAGLEHAGHRISGDLLFATFGYLQRSEHCAPESNRMLIELAERYIGQGADVSPFSSPAAFDDSLYITALHDGYAAAAANVAAFAALLAAESIAQLLLRGAEIEAAEQRFRALWAVNPTSIGYCAKTLQCVALRDRADAARTAAGVVEWCLTMPESKIWPPMDVAIVSYCRGFVCWLAGRRKEAELLLRHSGVAANEGLSVYDDLVTRRH